MPKVRPERAKTMKVIAQNSRCGLSGIVEGASHARLSTNCERLLIAGVAGKKKLICSARP